MLHTFSFTTTIKSQVKVAFGEPIDIASLDEEQKKHLADYCHGKVQELYDSIK